ncbi:MAG: hypothetical protein WKF77_01970 [Planctomycetaceae bacterium]
MPLTLDERTLRRAAVVDDDPMVRAGYAEALEDLGIEPWDVRELTGNLSDIWDSKFCDCDAVISDLKLMAPGYAPFNGGTLLAECWRKKLPAVLCTSYSDVSQLLPRSERRRVAAILPRTHFDLGKLREGLLRSIGELEGRFTPERRPWRTQVEIVDVPNDSSYVWIIVMGRSPDEKVMVYTKELPAEVQGQVQPGMILHAKVNTGAKSAQDLFFDEWEPK